MVLRKKDSHISFLHLYHHAGMVLGSYICARFLPGELILLWLIQINLKFGFNLGGHATLLGVINLFVHGIMYFYYFLTSFEPELKKSIWWKKHITQIQMASNFAIYAKPFSQSLLKIISDSICNFDLPFWTTRYILPRLWLS